MSGSTITTSNYGINQSSKTVQHYVPPNVVNVGSVAGLVDGPPQNLADGAALPVGTIIRITAGTVLASGAVTYNVVSLA